MARFPLMALLMAALFAMVSTVSAQEPTPPPQQPPQQPPEQPPEENQFEEEEVTQALEAEQADTETSGGFWDHMAHSDRLLGTFGGGRTWLEDRGLTFDLFYNGYFARNTTGGAGIGNEYSHSFDFLTRFNTEKAGWWDGGSAILHVKSTHGDSVNPLVAGLAQVVDDADFDEYIWIAQLWYHHGFLKNDALRFRFGYLFQQVDVDRNLYANAEDIQFWNEYLDNNPMVPLKIGMGLNAFYTAADWLDFMVGVSDADNRIKHDGWNTAFDGFDSLMVYFETRTKASIDTERGGMEGNFRFGLWYDPRAFEAASPSGNPDDESAGLGGYVSFDQMLYREGPEDLQGLGAFFRWGMRDGRYIYRRRYGAVDATDMFWSCGAQYQGLLPSRENDVLGVAWYYAAPSSYYQDDVDADYVGEQGLETYYRIQLTPWFAITPDFQYIWNPGGLRSAEDAVVIGLRARVRF